MLRRATSKSLNKYWIESTIERFTAGLLYWLTPDCSSVPDLPLPSVTVRKCYRLSFRVLFHLKIIIIKKIITLHRVNMKILQAVDLFSLSQQMSDSSVTEEEEIESGVPELCWIIDSSSQSETWVASIAGNYQILIICRVKVDNITSLYWEWAGMTWHIYNIS